MVKALITLTGGTAPRMLIVSCSTKLGIKLNSRVEEARGGTVVPVHPVARPVPGTTIDENAGGIFEADIRQCRQADPMGAIQTGARRSCTSPILARIETASRVAPRSEPDRSASSRISISAGASSASKDSTAACAGSTLLA